LHILITDSGVGGLSVCAYAERFLRKNKIDGRFRLTYVNASRENDFGYNSMASRREKIDHFNRYLDIINSTYSPDLIYIACNTLSVLYGETRFSRTARVPVQGIVETGVDCLLRELERSADAIAAIFGTDTTIEEGTYTRLLLAEGIGESRVIAQACPSLADTISEDREGSLAKQKIARYVGDAIEKSSEKNERYVAYLACTHYGYRKDYFTKTFEDRNLNVSVLNPNEFVAEELFSDLDRSGTKSEENTEIEVEFIARYRIPETALETISFFLEAVSPTTIAAFRDYTYAPDLF
jgi:glutamate racemase